MPEAQLTHPTSFIALLLHFFHYCYRLPFQYLWLGVTVPIEFTLWPYGEPLLTTTPTLLHTHTLTHSLPYCFSPLNLNTPLPCLFSFLPSLELFFSSLKNSDNDLPWKHTTSIHFCLVAARYNLLNQKRMFCCKRLLCVLLWGNILA